AVEVRSVSAEGANPRTRIVAGLQRRERARVLNRLAVVAGPGDGEQVPPAVAQLSRVLPQAHARVESARHLGAAGLDQRHFVETTVTDRDGDQVGRGDDIVVLLRVGELGRWWRGG